MTNTNELPPVPPQVTKEISERNRAIIRRKQGSGDFMGESRHTKFWTESNYLDDEFFQGKVFTARHKLVKA